MISHTTLVIPGSNAAASRRGSGCGAGHSDCRPRGGGGRADTISMRAAALAAFRSSRARSRATAGKKDRAAVYIPEFRSATSATMVSDSASAVAVTPTSIAPPAAPRSRAHTTATVAAQKAPSVRNTIQWPEGKRGPAPAARLCALYSCSRSRSARAPRGVGGHRASARAAAQSASGSTKRCGCATFRRLGVESMEASNLLQCAAAAASARWKAAIVDGASRSFKTAFEQLGGG